MLSRSVDDTLSAVAPAAAWVEALLAEAKLDEDLRHDLHVCLEEALANLIMHGKPRGGDKGIAVAVNASHDGATLVVTDRCISFDVTDDDAFNLATAPSDTRIGGHGLRLLRTLAGDLKYHSGKDQNELRMRFGTGARAPAASELIRGIAAFAATPDRALAELIQAATPISFEIGDELLTQGEASEFALILLSGEAEIVHHSQHGDAPVAQIASPALVGEIGALARLPRTASVRARTSVSGLRISRADLLSAGRHFPDLLVSVISQLGQQIQNINAALGLYAAGLSALERDDFDPSILTDLNNPSNDLRNFATAFQRLANRVSAERRARAELASAALIQRAMLPPALDSEVLRDRCDAFADMKPARKVGGDLFDLTLLDNDRLALVVGDVCGKGVPASLFMCATVTALRLAARNESDLGKLIEQANDGLSALNAESMFTTLFYGVLDLRDGRLTYVNCGHTAPFILDHRGCTELPGHGPPLGFFPGQRWTAQSIDLGPGDAIFIFSDGVTECFNPQGEEYGEARLAELLTANRTRGAKGLVQAVVADAERFADGAEQSDDITCLAAFMPRA